MTTKQKREIDKYIMKFLKERQLLHPVENVIFAPKAFVVASVIRHCKNEQSKGKLNENQMKVFFKALYDYEKGAIDLFWEEGVLKALKLGDPINEEKQQT